MTDSLYCGDCKTMVPGVYHLCAAKREDCEKMDGSCRLEAEVKVLRGRLDAIRMYVADGQWLPCNKCVPAAEIICELADGRRP